MTSNRTRRFFFIASVKSEERNTGIYSDATFIVAGKNRKTFPLNIECSSQDEAELLSRKLALVIRAIALLDSLDTIRETIRSSSQWAATAEWFNVQHRRGYWVALYAERLGIFTSEQFATQMYNNCRLHQKVIHRFNDFTDAFVCWITNGEIMGDSYQGKYTPTSHSILETRQDASAPTTPRRAHVNSPQASPRCTPGVRTHGKSSVDCYTSSARREALSPTPSFVFTVNPVVNLNTAQSPSPPTTATMFEIDSSYEDEGARSEHNAGPDGHHIEMIETRQILHLFYNIYSIPSAVRQGVEQMYAQSQDQQDFVDLLSVLDVPASHAHFLHSIFRLQANRDYS